MMEKYTTDGPNTLQSSRKHLQPNTKAYTSPMLYARGVSAIRPESAYDFGTYGIEPTVALSLYVRRYCEPIKSISLR